MFAVHLFLLIAAVLFLLGLSLSTWGGGDAPILWLLLGGGGVLFFMALHIVDGVKELSDVIRAVEPEWPE